MAVTGSRQQDGNSSEAWRSSAVPCVAVSVLTLPPQCTLLHAAALRASLLGALAADGDIHLGAGAIQAVDTAGLQVLAAFLIELRQQGRRAQWQQITAPLQAAAKQLGLQQVLGIDARAVLP